MKLGLIITAFLMTSSAFAKSTMTDYEVPGFPNNTYEMGFRLEVDGDRVSARYELPLDLTGARNRIEVRGTFSEPGVALLQGQKGEILCNFNLNKCDARYKDLNIDLDQVRQRLVSQGFSADQVELGLTISRRFEGDPIGIIHLSK